ncbi:MAG: cell division protein FtsX [Flavobacteriaceae bacterium]|nr:cell division protein FtsX [Flavobacteriaceae bacterium]
MKKNQEDKYQKRKLLSNYFSVILINLAVVFLTGFFALVLFNSNKLANYFKENLALTIYFKDNSKPIEIEQIKKTIQLKKTTKEIKFISKEEAAKIYANEIGEDFMEFLGYNPLLSSLDVYFKADYVKPEIIEEMSNSLKKYTFIDEVQYDQPLLNLLEENINKIKFWMSISGLILIIIAFILINSSIRLSIYSKRFSIKTMQMVGATKWFIKKPIIFQYLKLSFISSCLGILLLIFFMQKIDSNFKELNLINDLPYVSVILATVFFLGLIMTFFCSFYGIKKFLNLTTDEIY